MNAKERITCMNKEGIAKMGTVSDPGTLPGGDEGRGAVCRAPSGLYTIGGIIDFCSDSGGRLVPIAQVSLDDDPKEAARELERPVKAGAKGGFFLPFNWKQKTPCNIRTSIPRGPRPRSWTSPSYLPDGGSAGGGCHKRFTELADNQEVFNFNLVYGCAVWRRGRRNLSVLLFHYGLFDRFLR